jgi:hypothetical protein
MEAQHGLRACPTESEAEAPETEINSPIPTSIQKKTVNKHDFIRVCLQSENIILLIGFFWERQNIILIRLSI